jgi:predicted 3-demethylubiquinone-9 3-methyltransferase (glyoxalase superfamily)
MLMQKITPFLWFENQAEAAAKFYTSIFKKSKMLNVARYTEAGAKVSGRPKNSVMTVAFEIAGQKFIALNGGPEFKFNEAISFVVSCKTQKKIDYFWKKLSAGGEGVHCGWLKDKFGVSWQIVPDLLDELMSGDPAKSQWVMQALLQMKKLDIKKLKAAAKRKEQA